MSDVDDSPMPPPDGSAVSSDTPQPQNAPEAPLADEPDDLAADAGDPFAGWPAAQSAAVIEEARIAGLDTGAIAVMLGKLNIELADSIRPELWVRVEQLLAERAARKPAERRGRSSKP